jgi:hypothetical protein
MVALEDAAPRLAAAVAQRHAQLVDALGALDREALLAPSRLAGWDRLTIACHLRYGAQALHDMTSAALAGHPAAFYPGGRTSQRPATLQPAPDETPQEVVASFADRCAQLDRLWAGLAVPQWSIEVVEPRDNVDLGSAAVARLAMLRLTEVEVHGSDLDLGLDEWSEIFIDIALPFRLDWLNTRRTNHHPFDENLHGSWLLVADDGPAQLITVDASGVRSRPATQHTPTTATIHTSRRDLLALLLGRPLRRPPHVTGDTSFGLAFSRSFPGP